MVYQFRFITVGAPTVGKSALLKRFADDSFTPQSVHTLGVEFLNKTVALDNEDVILELWDTAGQERFRSIIRSYYRKAIGVLLVFDLTDNGTFEQLPGWYSDVIEASGPRPPIFVLLGNKTDLTREVARSDAEVFASERNMDYFETSAKTGENVEAAFMSLADKVYDGVEKGAIPVGLPLHWEGGKKRGSRRNIINLHKKKVNKKTSKRCC